ncbi:MAG: methylisocitrate lyase [Candidatus Omnitrophica bacterium]|nr:methylisocitrate lyase [Candidatus Omnitrophota bacterium]
MFAPWWGARKGFAPLSTKSSHLRKLLDSPGLIQAPGVFNPLLARLVERVGFPAVYVSGAGLSNGMLGLPDVGLLSMTEVTRMAGQIARVTSLPVICDADTGYGGPGMIRRAVEEFIEQGVAGIHLEDQVADKKCGHLPGKQLVPIQEMVDRLEAAGGGRTDPDFVLIARTDARAGEGFEGALERAKAYIEAGADMIFPEALQSLEEFQKFAESVSVPILANMTEFGKSPLLTAQELEAAGVKMAIYPQTCLRIMMKASEEVLHEILERGTQAGVVDKMQTREELYQLLDYEGWKV